MVPAHSPMVVAHLRCILICRALLQLISPQLAAPVVQARSYDEATNSPVGWYLRCAGLVGMICNDWRPPAVLCLAHITDAGSLLVPAAACCAVHRPMLTVHMRCCLSTWLRLQQCTDPCAEPPAAGAAGAGSGPLGALPTVPGTGGGQPAARQRQQQQQRCRQCGGAAGGGAVKNEVLPAPSASLF